MHIYCMWNDFCTVGTVVDRNEIYSHFLIYFALVGITIEHKAHKPRLDAFLWQFETPYTSMHGCTNDSSQHIAGQWTGLKAWPYNKPVKYLCSYNAGNKHTRLWSSTQLCFVLYYSPTLPCVYFHIVLYTILWTNTQWTHIISANLSEFLYICSLFTHASEPVEDSNGVVLSQEFITIV